MKNLFATTLFATTLFAAPLHAETMPMHNGSMTGGSTMQSGAMQNSPMSSTAPMSDGVVRKIDAANGKITLRHGPIVNIDMPPMTMVFRAQPQTLLNAVKVGDTVKFHAESVNGALVVTAIEVVR